MNWGLTVKRLREEKGMTQGELALKADIGRSHLSRIELGHIKTWDEDLLKKLAYGLDTTFEDILSDLYGKPTETRREVAEELLDRLKTEMPLALPVRKEFTVHAGEPVSPPDYVYLERRRYHGRNIEAYPIHGHCMEPELRTGDIVIVDRDAPIDDGSLIICSTGEQVIIGRVVRRDGVLWLENKLSAVKVDECVAAAKVILSQRRH